MARPGFVPESSCGICPIRTKGICGALSDRDLARLERVKEAPRRIPPGHDIFSQGEPLDDVFNILGGWAFLYELLEDGRRQILHFAIPGDLAGFRAGSRAASTFGLQAIDHVELCVIPRRELMALALDHPGMALRLMAALSADERQAYERITSMGRKTASERVAALLLELFYRLRRRPPRFAGEELRLPLTQTLIADATGLTPVHTNRMLGELRQKGIIAYGSGRFHILDPGRLFEAAGVDPDLCAWTPDPPGWDWRHPVPSPLGPQSHLGRGECV